jgi:hypothetical protein
MHLRTDSGRCIVHTVGRSLTSNQWMLIYGLDAFTRMYGSRLSSVFQDLLYSNNMYFMDKLERPIVRLMSDTSRLLLDTVY